MGLTRKFEHLKELSLRKGLPERIKKLREIGLNGLIEGLNSVLPENLMRNYVNISEIGLEIEHDLIPFDSFSKILIIGGGKATANMCGSLVEIIGNKLPFSGVINIPYGQNSQYIDGNQIFSKSKKSFVDINFCSHPIPDEAGVIGVQKMLDLLSNSDEKTLIITLISGGGSSLMPLPANGLTLDDLQQVNKLLLECGANIQEVNCVRKHISAFKGGQLSVTAYPRKIYSLIISDVIGNDLQTIASGPTVPDLTFFATAVEICQRYHIMGRLPAVVRERLLEGEENKIDETPKPGSNIIENTTNLVIGSADTSAAAVLNYFLNSGIESEIFSHNLEGEARNFGINLCDMLPKFKSKNYLAVFIGTGEFTVTIKGKGKGGRNQEMLLAFLAELKSDPEYKAHHLNYVIISGAFDGIEGNSPALGAIIDSTSIEYIDSLKINPVPFLEDNNSYEFFEKIGDAIVTGQTGTNVNDMLLIIIEKNK
jgi:glycerate 2-kinase